MRCARCKRTLRHPVYVAGMPLGSTCAMAVAGAKPKRREKREVRRDESTLDLFHVEPQP